MADKTTTKTTTQDTKTEQKPKEEQTIARKINAWGFIALLGLLFLVFGPIAAFLSWRSNTLEGTNIALKIIFAILAYIGNFFYIIWFAIMKTIVPKTDTTDIEQVSESSFSPFSSSPQRASPPAPAPMPAPTSTPASAAFPAKTVDDDMMLDKVDNHMPAANPNQQGGKKKTKLRRRK